MQAYSIDMIKTSYLQQMFDFLNKLSHNHQSPPQSQPIIFQQLSSDDDQIHLHKSQSQKERNNQNISSKSNSTNKPQTIEKDDRLKKKHIKRGNSIVGKLQIVEKVQLNPNVIAILKGSLAQNQKELNNYLIERVKKVKNDRERKVYIREMARDEEQYLNQIGKQIQVNSYFLQQGLTSTVNSIIDTISKEIEISQIPIRLKRKKFQDLQQERKQETLKIIKMRESELQQKIGQLSVELSFGEEAAERRANQMLSKDQFDPDSLKTKLAGQFVKEKQREREEKKIKLEEYREKKKTIEIQLKEAEQEKKQQQKNEKHERLVKQFAEKQRIKKIQEQKTLTQQLNYKEFLKQYKQLKPLYQQKQQQFQNRLKQQKKQRYYALKEKQSKYEPLNMQVLQMHEQRYEQLRKQDKQRKYAQLQLEKQKQLLLKKQLDQKIYKGRFRYIVLQEMADAEVQKKQKQAQKQSILMKKQAYSLEVKHHFKPTVDPIKRQQIQQILSSHKQQKRKFMTPNRVTYSQQYSTILSHHPYSQPEADPKKEGQKYHRLFKQYIRNKIEKGQVKNDDDLFVKKVAQRPDYLKQLRQKYEGRIPSKSTRLEKQIEKLREGEDYRALILRAQLFEKKAKQRQIKLRNVAHSPGQQAQLQEEYLCAIKAKMELINNMN